eukprot:7422660-Pyramimonas_sp.AAC.1
MCIRDSPSFTRARLPSYCNEAMQFQELKRRPPIASASWREGKEETAKRRANLLKTPLRLLIRLRSAADRLGEAILVEAQPVDRGN